MTTYRLTIMHTGPDRWRWTCNLVQAEDHVSPVSHGQAESRAKAEELARAWAAWHHEKHDSQIERIDIELP